MTEGETSRSRLFELGDVTGVAVVDLAKDEDADAGVVVVAVVGAEVGAWVAVTVVAEEEACDGDFKGDEGTALDDA